MANKLAETSLLVLLEAQGKLAVKDKLKGIEAWPEDILREAFVRNLELHKPEASTIAADILAAANILKLGSRLVGASSQEVASQFKPWDTVAVPSAIAKDTLTIPQATVGKLQLHQLASIYQ